MGLLWAALAGCGRGADPRPASAQFRAAWDKRRAGDEAGYRTLMQDIAQRWPDSRPGRRARKEKDQPAGTPSLIGASALFGVVAAVAIPALMTLRSRALGAPGPTP